MSEDERMKLKVKDLPTFGTIDISVAVLIVFLKLTLQDARNAYLHPWDAVFIFLRNAEVVK